MLNKMGILLAAATLVFGVPTAQAAVEIGKPAPNFTAQSADGKKIKLSDYKGKIVVLEWHNPQCPFIRKFYSSGEMQKLQKAVTGKDVVWLSINSGAKGNQGYMNGAEAKAYLAERKAAPTAYLLDGNGKIGHLYGAKTTPHMFVIDSKGMLAYQGAIDDRPSTNPDDIERAKNYVTAAIDALEEGKTPETASTQSYGCAVKY